MPRCSPVIDARQERLLVAVDGERTIEEICGEQGDWSLARAFFQQRWRWDQIVFDTSRDKHEMIKPGSPRFRLTME
jgi:hypothetical protein